MHRLDKDNKHYINILIYFKFVYSINIIYICGNKTNMTVQEKQLIPYLAHGLNIEILNHKNDYVGIQFAEANGFYLINDELFVTYKGGSTGKSMKDFRPVLKSMREVSQSKVYQYAALNYDNLKVNMKWSMGFYIDDRHEYQVNYYPLEIVEMLIENHFDIYGLETYFNTIHKSLK